MNHQDIKGAMDMAREDHGAVRSELRELAKETRLRVLQGKDREEFLRGMTQKEFDFLHKIAVSMGPKGINALEKMLNEAEQVIGGGQ